MLDRVTAMCEIRVLNERLEALKAAARKVCAMDEIGRAAPSWDVLPPDWQGRWDAAVDELRRLSGPPRGEGE